MKTKIIARLVPALLATLVIACRSTPDVVVVDPTGTPVAGAAVEPVTLSTNGETILTNSKGEANIESRVQAVQTINVRKAGYADQKLIKFVGPKPIRVTLTP